MAAPIKAMGAGVLALILLAACSSPPTSTAAPETPASAKVADVASAPASQATPASSPASTSETQIDASQLPEDVREFILKQRMCRHFSRPEAEGGNPAMAGVMCVGADETAWKSLVRKYQDDDAIASILLAERPPTNGPKK